MEWGSRSHHIKPPLSLPPTHPPPYPILLAYTYRPQPIRLILTPSHTLGYPKVSIEFPIMCFSYLDCLWKLKKDCLQIAYGLLTDRYICSALVLLVSVKLCLLVFSLISKNHISGEESADGNPGQTHAELSKCPMGTP